MTTDEDAQDILLQFAANTKKLILVAVSTVLYGDGLYWTIKRVCDSGLCRKTAENLEDVGAAEVHWLSPAAGHHTIAACVWWV